MFLPPDILVVAGTYAMKNARVNPAEVYIGPAGWSYKDWVGPVYPAGTKVDQLVTIARYFDCIELNSSFYRIPGERLVESWSTFFPAG